MNIPNPFTKFGYIFTIISDYQHTVSTVPGNHNSVAQIHITPSQISFIYINDILYGVVHSSIIVPQTSVEQFFIIVPTDKCIISRLDGLPQSLYSELNSAVDKIKFLVSFQQNKSSHLGTKGPEAPAQLMLALKVQDRAYFEQARPLLLYLHG